MAFGTPDEVAAELGRPTTSITAAQRAQWQQWLDRVERNIRREFKRRGLDLMNQVGLGDPQMDDVGDIEVAAVARKVRNPDGSTSTTVTVDDGTVTRRRDGVKDLGADPLELTESEWEALFPNAHDERDAGSTRPGFQPDCPVFWP